MIQKKVKQRVDNEKSMSVVQVKRDGALINDDHQGTSDVNKPNDIEYQS